MHVPLLLPPTSQAPHYFLPMVFASPACGLVGWGESPTSGPGALLPEEYARLLKS